MTSEFFDLTVMTLSGIGVTFVENWSIISSYPKYLYFSHPYCASHSSARSFNCGLTFSDCLHFHGCPSIKLWASQQDLMIPGERWQLARRCLQPGQLWTPWDSLDESILHFYSQEKGEDNCSVLMAASNCFERWRTVIKPGVTNHLDSDKSLESHSEHVVFVLFMQY